MQEILPTKSEGKRKSSPYLKSDIMKKILLIILLSYTLLAQNSSTIPTHIQKALCQKLAKSNFSLQNSCKNGSTIEYATHFLTNDNQILLFLYLNEHKERFGHYPPLKVPLIINQKGEWSILEGKNTIPEAIQSISSDPYGGIWIEALWVIEGAISTLYHTRDGKNMQLITLPSSKEENGYYEGIQNICYQLNNIVLTFEPFKNYSKELWTTPYSRAVSKNPKWRAISTTHNKCIKNQGSSQWQIIKNLHNITFRNSKTGKAITIPTTTSTDKKRYYIQLGAFKNRGYAESVQNRLKRLPYPPRLRQRRVGRELYYKLLIGPFNSRTKADLVRHNLPHQQSDAFILIEN